MQYITTDKSEIEKIAEYQHDYLTQNRADYNATEWGYQTSDNGYGYAISIIPEAIVYLRFYENLTYTQNGTVEPHHIELMKDDVSRMSGNTDYLLSLLDASKLQERLTDFQNLNLDKSKFKYKLPNDFYLPKDDLI